MKKNLDANVLESYPAINIPESISSCNKENYSETINIIDEKCLPDHFPDDPINQTDQSLGWITADWLKIQSWNKTEKIFPDKTIHSLFEAQTNKTPHNIAVSCQDQQLTYLELNNRANQLALDLVNMDFNIETSVVIYLPSGVNAIIAILAVLKAGGTYIPIDVNYPQERIKFLINDSQSKTIITDSQKITYFSNLANQPSVINIDEKTWCTAHTDNLNLSISPKNAMYIIYTSGSTGTPKGVVVEHHSVVNMAFSCIDMLGINSTSRILQIASFSFDVFVAEWCMSLLSGASLYLMSHSFFSPEIIIESLKTYHISTIILASSILSTLPFIDLPKLKVIACGGEPCNPTTINFWAKNRLFLNIFGITEASVCSTAKIFKPGASNTRIIGKPLPNTQIYILNEHQKTLPIGITGEMWIGGTGIARQYHNNNQLTQDKFKFIALPHGNASIKYRLYRTGDFARWLPNGDLEFIGRKDDQLKIRGVRIEIGEIEYVLEKHPTIVKAIVLVKSSEGIQELYGYIFTGNQEIDLVEVKQFLHNQLPSYMIPNKLIIITHIPLTPNGKVDKKKLLLIKEEKKLSPNTELSNLERIILTILSSILKTENISINVNFFDLGLDSFSLIQFYAQLSQKIDTKINIADLFTYVTIKDLANYLDRLSVEKQHITKL